MFIQHRCVEGSSVDFCIENQLSNSSSSAFLGLNDDVHPPLCYLRYLLYASTSLPLSLSLCLSFDISLQTTVYLFLLSCPRYISESPVSCSERANLIPRVASERELNTPANARRVIYAKMKTLRRVCIRLTGLTVAPVLMILSGGGRIWEFETGGRTV